VVGSPAAAEVATSLGYTNVTSLQAGARTTVMPRRRQSNSTAGAVRCQPYTGNYKSSFLNPKPFILNFKS
jgi:hypothetical protein